MLIDSHAHLDMLEDAEAALMRAATVGVTAVITIGVDVATSEWAVNAADRFPNVWATVGLHPHDAKDGSPEALRRIEELAASGDRVVGVGEVGLDYFYDNSPRDEQRRVFIEHIRIARVTGKTLVIHTRDAWDDTFALLAEQPPPPRIVFHCWTGGPEEAERAIAIGAWLSFSGIVTFPNAQPIRDAALITPAHQILVETDAPFLAPIPHRGKKNEPAHVRHTADTIAQLKSLSIPEMESILTANTRVAFML